ncbi:hypothetical protein TNIN_493921 [Trichonephila inaurata madagascariensis]|uniref:Uncharacterized protein n=1 Tax=Trichonephila inaurata madagascariensis TaxID=2747483 RepID=A0A8X6JYP9_9ARAC|nr:hypothetical protein TNIN_493921 [Trichonephila inaurata madagascariensis]
MRFYGTQKSVEVKGFTGKGLTCAPDHTSDAKVHRSHNCRYRFAVYKGSSVSMDVENAQKSAKSEVRSRATGRRVFVHAEIWQRHPAAAARRWSSSPFFRRATTLCRHLESRCCSA